MNCYDISFIVAGFLDFNKIVWYSLIVNSSYSLSYLSEKKIRRTAKTSACLERSERILESVRKSSNLFKKSNAQYPKSSPKCSTVAPSEGRYSSRKLKDPESAIPRSICVETDKIRDKAFRTCAAVMVSHGKIDDRICLRQPTACGANLQSGEKRASPHKGVDYVQPCEIESMAGVRKVCDHDEPGQFQQSEQWVPCCF